MNKNEILTVLGFVAVGFLTVQYIKQSKKQTGQKNTAKNTFQDLTNMDSGINPYDLAGKYLPPTFTDLVTNGVVFL